MKLCPTVLFVLCLCAALPARAGTGPAVLENRALRVELMPDTGRIRVLEKAGGRTWEQPLAPQSTPVRVTLRRADGPVRSGNPIVLNSAMLGDARQVSGDRDCSARAWLSWDEKHLYLAADVSDDALRFGPSGDPVWERDSIEVWIGSRQLSLALSPSGSQAYAGGSERLTGGRITLATREGGYRVDASLPWAWASAGLAPKPGERLRVAVGINDADTASREGQIYWPGGWTHSQANTFAEAVLGDAEGNAPAAAQAPGPVYRVIGEKPGALEVERSYDTAPGRRTAVRLRFLLPTANAPDLRVEATTADLKAPTGDVRVLDAFVLDAPRGALAVADYTNGHLYPLDLHPFPRTWLEGNRLDMPWVGLCDLDSGSGYLILLETSDDSAVSMQKVTGKGGRPLVAPTVVWRPEKGAFGYPRSMLFHFARGGGYVALCKRYREYARTQGLIVPFSEKVKKIPHLTRLFGAPDVWGNASLRFAREARAAGVEKMLIHGRPASPADMSAIRDLGYLPSEYDNYTDIMQTKDGQISSGRAILPDHAVQRRDGQRMTAWITWDKQQYMKRCPALWKDAARQVADRVLAEWPFLARFIDVTTAESLYECFDPAHPLTHQGKRACGPELISTFRDRKLVMGGEHGIWWAVPVLDYIEGMQSGNSYTWPAGYLIHPKSKEEEFTYPGGGKTAKWEAYEKWGIGHETRVPLWELVFHDCIVSTWYWGDASDWLLDAAPEVTPKKDALNVLCGTIPLLWANAEGSWGKDRAVFLRTYRNTCKLHEVVAGTEMLSHEFVTADRAVQRTRFSDGTECVVNFGEAPYRAAVAGKAYLLPRNGWAVKGPKIEQSLALESGTPVTTIRAAGYAFCDRGGVPVTLRAEGAGRARVIVDKAAPSVTLRPAETGSRWSPEGALLYRLDSQGTPADLIAFRPAAGGAITFGPLDGPTSLLLLWGPGVKQPDLRAADLRLSTENPRQGDRLRVTATLTNAGAVTVSGADVEFLVDGVCLSRAKVSVKARGSVAVSAEVDTDRVDGTRRLDVRVDGAGAVTELCEANNAASRTIHIHPNWAHWPHRRLLRVDSGPVAREDTPVIVPFELPAGADPGSVRVALLDAAGQPDTPLPAQLDGRELCLVLPGNLPAGETRRCAVLWRDAPAPGKPGALPLGSSSWHEEVKGVVTPAYEARFENGSPTFLAPRRDGVTGARFLKSLIVSSADTGWSDEGRDVKEMRVVYAGPVRTVVEVRKALKTGAVYEKRYLFYARHFELETSLDKPAGGLYARAHYAQKGTYVDNKGNRAEMDGRGDADNVAGRNPNPKWYAVYQPGWAHSCVALSPFENITYWDAGSESLGAIGFTTAKISGLRMAYTIHPGATDAAFADQDYRRLTTPVSAAWE